MKYLHSCTITRTAETISATGGVPTAGATSTVYSGKCDAQENSRRFNVQSGLVSSRGSATVYLPDGYVLLYGIREDDAITVTWTDGTTRTGRVDSSDNLEDSFLMLYS